MANAEHLEILKLGVGKWNEWRSSQVLFKADFSGANLSNMNLSGINLVNANLSDVSFIGANLSSSNLTGANLKNANLSKADLSKAQLLGAYLYKSNLTKTRLHKTNLYTADLGKAKAKKADFTKSDLTGAKISKINLYNANLSNAILVGANLSKSKILKSNLINADLSGAKLSKVDLSETDLSNANLSNANLMEARLFDSILFRANLSNAILSESKMIHTNLIESNLSNAYLSHAVLKNANLLNANLTEANLLGANLTYAKLDNTNFTRCKIGNTILGLINLNTCKGLETIEVTSECSIDFQTLRISKNIPKSFLLKIGLPELYIDYLPDFFSDTLTLFPAFLSHSKENREFARKLYEALIAKGVNVFFDEKELKPGDSLVKTITKGINHYDKTILVCSKESLASKWVDYELELVLKKELALMEQKETDDVSLLIPVTIDDQIFSWNGDKEWIKDRYIGDFREWQDSAKFEKALNELIQALNVKRLDIKPPTHF